MIENNYCVIMAGGVGSRFWPISRTQKPKQFLDILGTGKTLLRQTFDRFANLCPPENIYIVTNKEYTQTVQEILPEINNSQILSEPMRRNTAPCIAYANHKIRIKNKSAKIIVAPSDHLILNESKFVDVLKECFDFVEKNDGMLTLGITPHRPETGYGYIQTDGSDKVFGNIQKVKTFTEKPDRQTAEAFLKSGEFFWNSGIFIWSLKTIDKAFEDYLPEISKLFNFNDKINAQNSEESLILKAYTECDNVSIDKGVMEHADNVFVYCTEFGWSDLGTWDSLYEKSNKDSSGNAIIGDNILTYETTNSIINVPKDKLVVIQGIDDFIIAESDNILLICKRNDERKIRQFVNDVKLSKGEEYI